jgi:predicted nucleic acid-binding protein
VLLIDNSAWVRLGDPALTDELVLELGAAIEDGAIAVSLPFILEAGYSARSGREHDELIGELSALPHLAIDEAVEERAVEAQRQLARLGHHRLPPVDVLIAALADRHGVGVLHYDRDYDVLAERTDLSFESRWLAAPGTI